MQNTNYFKGIFFIILSSLSFATMAIFVRLAGNINFIQKSFFRNFISFFIALITVIIEGKKNGFEQFLPQRKAVKYLFLRSIAGTIGIFGNFYAIDHLILADAGILNKMAPFWTVIFCILLIGESIKLIPFIAICIAFCGAILVVKPSFNFSQTIPSLAGFISGMGAGIAYACLRKLGLLKCNGKIVVLFFGAFSMIISIPFIIFYHEPMTVWQITMLLLSGICAASGQFSITAAYYHAPASKISIFDFSQIIFSASLGFFIFGQVPDIYSFVGYIIIFGMAVFNFIWNQRKKTD